jgi:hypothetical protein
MKLLALVCLTGCIVTSHTSFEILGDRGSRVALAARPDAAATEIARLMTERGYPILDQRPISSGFVLELGGRTQAGHVSSIFDVTVQASASGSVVYIIGRPGVGWTFKDSFVIDGSVEAAVIHGVFSELALERWVIGELLAGDPAATCQARRRAAFDHALASNDRDQRDRELAALPRC